MSNRIFISMPFTDKERLDGLVSMLGDDIKLMSQHGNSGVVNLYGGFKFEPVVPAPVCTFRCIICMLRCPFVYMPRGWQNDKCSRKVFAWAEVLGKKIIFEEDGRCR